MKVEALWILYFAGIFMWFYGTWFLAKIIAKKVEK